MEDHVHVVAVFLQCEIVLLYSDFESLFSFIGVAAAQPDRDTLAYELAWHEISVFQVRVAFKAVQDDLNIPFAAAGNVIDITAAGIDIGHLIVVGDIGRLVFGRVLL